MKKITIQHIYIVIKQKQQEMPHLPNKTHNKTTAWPWYRMFCNKTRQGQCICEVSSKSNNSLTSYWSGTIFTLIEIVTLTFDQVIPNLKWIIYWQRPTYMGRIRVIGQSFKLLIGKEPAHRPTDRRGEIIKYYRVWHFIQITR